MGIVISHDPLPIGLMERQGVTYAMRHDRGSFNTPCMYLHPIAMILLHDLLGQLEQRFDALNVLHGVSVSIDDKVRQCMGFYLLTFDHYAARRSGSIFGRLPQFVIVL